jgi:hypothetical protein
MRGGERVHRLDALRPLRLAKVVKDLWWSHDNRRLLVRVSDSQDEADMGLGRIWCLCLRDGRARRLSDGTATRAECIGAKRVRYWTGRVVPGPADPSKGSMVKTPHDRECL